MLWYFSLIMNAWIMLSLQDGLSLSARSSLGLKVLNHDSGGHLVEVAEAIEEEDAADGGGAFVIRLPKAKPFDTIKVRLAVKADLGQSKDAAYVEHRVRNKTDRHLSSDF